MDIKFWGGELVERKNVDKVTLKGVGSLVSAHRAAERCVHTTGEVCWGLQEARLLN